MGTNFYLRQPVCPHCGNAAGADLHIGKASGGWNFGLRIYPLVDGKQDDRLKSFGVESICELVDWLPLFERFPIFDEYDRPVDPAEMRRWIAERSHPNGLLSRLTAGREHMGPYSSFTRGDTFAGKGTYDLCNYEFS